MADPHAHFVRLGCRADGVQELKLSNDWRAVGWMAFWGLTGGHIGYTASAFANGLPLDYSLIEVLNIVLPWAVLAAALRYHPDD